MKFLQDSCKQSSTYELIIMTIIIIINPTQKETGYYECKTTKKENKIKDKKQNQIHKNLVT